MGGILSRRDERQLIKVKENGTTLDRIWANLLFGSEQISLTSKEVEMKQRYERAWMYLCDLKSTQETIVELSNDFPDLSKAQLYRDVAATKRLFGDITKSSRAADTFLLSEMASYAFKLAKDARDVEGMNRAVANLIKIKGLDKDEVDVFSDEDVPEHSYYMVVNLDGKAQKVELSCLNDLPHVSKGLLQRLSAEITDIDAVEIMER